MVDSANLSFVGVSRERSSRSLDIRGYSLTGKTAILHIVISGSRPDNSNSSRSSIGRAGLWRCLGYKFKSYLEHSIYIYLYLFFIAYFLSII